MRLGLRTKIIELHKFPGVGISAGLSKRLAVALAGINSKSDFSSATVQDLLSYHPMRYEDRSSLVPIDRLEQGKPLSVELFVRISGAYRVGKNRPTKSPPLYIFEISAGDRERILKPVVVWWFVSGRSATRIISYYNEKFARGTRFVVHGEWEWDPRRNTYTLKPQRPEEIEILEKGAGVVEAEGALAEPDEENVDLFDPRFQPVHSGRKTPVYRKLGGFQTKRLREIVFGVLSELHSDEVPEVLPQQTVKRFKLIPRAEAVRRIHFPSEADSLADYERFRSESHRRLIFEEFFRLSVLLELRKVGRTKQVKGSHFEIDPTMEKEVLAVPPFSLTNAQRRVLGEIFSDMRSDSPMNRLVQGDVGSGKTIVAFLSMLVAVRNGYQAVMMAPTEILAEQHFRNAKNILEPLGITVELLTGSLKSSAKKTIKERTRVREVDVVIGTHAIIQEGVEFKCLGFAVIDEQHRFGVLQRVQLMEKGLNPDVLIMTATPIPRSLAMTVYGDLDVSIIDELPPGRTPIKTVVVGEDKRSGVYRGIERELRLGRQVYVVYPLVEESEKLELKAATEMFEKLRTETFPNRSVGLLHGRMKQQEKERVMDAFKAGELDILVATTVIEVGVDVPNASVMVVEHAERFGLSQLHQLRGRVGRGAEQSYCILMTDFKKTAVAKERLGIMEETNDGFKIAEKDLLIRGQGEILGTRQSGLSTLAEGDIVRDFDILKVAQKEAVEWMKANSTSSEGRRLLSDISEDPRLKLGSVG